MIERVGDVVVYDGSDAEEDEEREGGVLWVFSRYIYIYILGGLLSSWLLVGVWFTFTWGVLMTCKELNQCFGKQNS